jgi:hypothetical protein
MSSRKENLFKSETLILEKSEGILERKDVSLEEYRESFKELCYNYSELLDQSRLITKVSDKLQNKLNTVNETLEFKNIELQSTIDELTKARVGRKAQTIILVIGLSLFILEELILEPVIDRLVNNNIWINIAVKLVIAFLLKPLESLVESALLKSAKKNKDEKPVATVFAA